MDAAADQKPSLNAQDNLRRDAATSSLRLRLVSVFSTKDAHLLKVKTAEWGAQSLTYRVVDFPYHVSAGSFFQVNRFLVDRLVQLVTADFSHGLVWDLYAGVGLFAQALSQRFEKVVAVEAAPSSWNDLRQNLQGTAHKTVRSGTLEFLRQQAIEPHRTWSSWTHRALGWEAASSPCLPK